MKISKKSAVLALMLAAGTAVAGPRESVSVPGPIDVWGFDDGQAFSTVTATFTGTDGGGAYSATGIRITSTITSNAVGTWAGDILVNVSTPGGGAYGVRLFPVAGGFGTFTGVVNVGDFGATEAPAGTWTFEFVDDFQDGPGTLDGEDPAAPESIVTDMIIALDDGVAVAPVSTDLGALIDGSDITQAFSLAAGEVKWFRFSVGDVNVAADRGLDITTNGSLGADSVLALYNADGTFANFDDDGGEGALSLLSFGSGIGGASTLDGATGQDGDLAAGTYYLAVGEFFTFFGDTQFLASGVDGFGGDYQVNVKLGLLPPVSAPTATDLGNRTATETFSVNASLNAGNEIGWYRIVLPEASTADSWVDIWTSAAADNSMADTEIGLYSAAGLRQANDDDGGPGLFSQLSFGGGAGANPRAANDFGAGPGLTFSDQAGPLAAGEYYLAVGNFNVNFLDTRFNALPTSAATTTNTTLNFRIQAAGQPIPPGATGSAVVNGNSVLFQVVVVPGSNPVSTGIAVSANLTSMGGAAAQALNDSGTNGDVTAGDGIYSYAATVPGTATDGQAFTIPFTVIDAQLRSVSGSVGFAADVAGELPATANVPSGTGSLDSITGSMGPNDTDMYRISICDFANFSASTVGGTTADTQLFLFNTDGVGVTFNDDSTGLQSTITGQFLSANGDFYLAVSRYDRDPIDSGANPLWIDTPFGVERTPDGAGAANPVDAWDGVNAGTAAYTIALTGACYSNGGGGCGPADIGGAGGAPGADGVLDNNDFIVYIDNFFNQAPSADIGAAGGVAGSDGLYDNNDFIVFIDQFFSGNC